MMDIQRGEVVIELEHIGEGFNGEYNPDDPEDMPLLRFTVLKLENDGSFPVDDGSYCTLLPAYIQGELKQAALKRILNEVYEPVKAGHSIKKLCERLSWISPEWLK